MKLINTDGMAFIGPGSEWFWTALQFTALAITFIAIYRQLRTQQVQIRGNTRLLQSQAHYNALSLAQRPWELMIENESLASVVNVGLTTPESLSAADWLRCSSYMFMQFNGWEYIYYQHRDDSIPKELWVGADATFKNFIETKRGYTRFWSESGLSFDEPFRSYVSGEFAKRPAPAGCGNRLGPGLTLKERDVLSPVASPQLSPSVRCTCLGCECRILTTLGVCPACTVGIQRDEERDPVSGAA